MTESDKCMVANLFIFTVLAGISLWWHTFWPMAFIFIFHYTEGEGHD